MLVTGIEGVQASAVWGTPVIYNFLQGLELNEEAIKISQNKPSQLCLSDQQNPWACKLEIKNAFRLPTLGQFVS